MRKPLIVANWKMNKNVDEALTFLHQILDELPDYDREEVGIAPQAFAIYPMMKAVSQTPLQIIGQNAASKCNGAYTGEISVRDLAAMGVNYVMLGHAERREIFKESNRTINQKLLTALREGVRPIVCTNGEQKMVGQHNSCYSIFRQLDNVLTGVPVSQVTRIVFSFEPTDAIGTGKHADLETAEHGCHLLRQEIGQRYGSQIANQVRILYGGSVNPNNIRLLMAASDIDGVLIGRASLDADSFIQMMNYQQMALAQVM
ncbi:MAG: triose-phosphate isomerase [[Lactobacillus] timonensis]|uniref:triose-phosphate isomerase n=1 Tax=[Lactobacillus] timonensis TaxID=1970790 RepID=UPI00235239FC|nr:triose-phosphate isomerase [[Lactobacillus] timonensis]MCI1925607.1 triose-phosphate isomerase [[Lactobacillus] timonensis]MCI1956965.1 triose-phosphate isomerase [[Lactobacillus] timonensis]MCI1969955.1 triose-phosphate isomerase [[Lactobacillus] timonensis]MCI2006156.1 triose-phosphate isomerase [[Lactobacillus] timonensis]